jgi:hypothetical protein
MELTSQKISGTFQGETLRIGGELYSTQDVGVRRTTATMAPFFNLPKFKFQSLELCGELRPPTSEAYWGAMNSVAVPDSDPARREALSIEPHRSAALQFMESVKVLPRHFAEEPLGQSPVSDHDRPLEQSA